MEYRELTSDEFNRLKRTGEMDLWSVSEVQELALAFEWEGYVIETSTQRQSVPRDALLPSPHKDDWRAQEAREWLEARDGEISHVTPAREFSINWPHVVFRWNRTYTPYQRMRLHLEMSKLEDDWYLVTFDTEFEDFFYNSPLLAMERETFWRCDQMDGLLALLRWAMPADVTGGGGKTNQRK